MNDQRTVQFALLLCIFSLLSSQVESAQPRGKGNAGAPDTPAESAADDKPENLAPYPRNPKLQPGKIQHQRYWFEAADKWMEYAVFVPSSYKPDGRNRKYPAIFALHGLGHNASGILHYPGFRELAEEHGYILIAPSGHGRAGWYGSRGHRMFLSFPRNLGELSEMDVLNVIQLAQRDYSIDRKRMYLLGHSMGGGGTLHIAMMDPSVWAALAPIAPAFYKSPKELEKIRNLPVIMVQGDKDRLVPVTRVRQLAEKMRELEMKHEYIEVAGGGHVVVAFENLPRIFEFFNQHKR